MAFTSIRSLLPSAARRAGITKDLAIADALRAVTGRLEQIFGGKYGAFAEAVAMHPDGSVVIACRSPAVAQTIRLHESEILTAVRSATPSLRIERVFLVPRSKSDAIRFGT